MRHGMTRICLALAVGLFSSVNTAAAQQDLSIYGYFATRLEKSFSVPSFDGTDIVKTTGPHEFSQPFFNIMAQHQFSPRFKAFVNLNGGGNAANGIEVRNAWGEFTASKAFTVRVGKSYRKFGLYNEILDAVPTYYGIEPPEAFDPDHFLISRTTTLMIYGSRRVGKGDLQYALSTDNGEGADRLSGTIPLGADLRYVFARGNATLGISGYTSNGATNSDVGPGSGSPRSAVLPFVARDSFTVINFYGEARINRLTLQAEYAEGSHKTQRDVDAVLDIFAGTQLNTAQRARFLLNPAGSDSDPNNIRTSGDYKAQMWYIRTGYSIDTPKGELGPYAQFDWYKNPETIASKTFGGDAEAGLADDGKFTKATAGLLFRPTPQVAFKLDSSIFRYRLQGENVTYPEVRFDVSYTFGL